MRVTMLVLGAQLPGAVVLTPSGWSREPYCFLRSFKWVTRGTSAPVDQFRIWDRSLDQARPRMPGN